LCNDRRAFIEISDETIGNLNLANNASIKIRAKGTVSIATDVDECFRKVSVHDALYRI